MSPERIGDMEPKSRIRIAKDENGVITVQVVQFDGAGLKGFGVVQYIEKGNSPQTYEALSNLIEAIKKDNERGIFPPVAYDPGWPNDPE